MTNSGLWPWIKRNVFRRVDARELAERMAAFEVLTDDPAGARFAVMQIDGQVRLVAEHLYLRAADIVHPRGTAGFDQFIRYWRIERSELEIRAAGQDVVIEREYSTGPLDELARIIGGDVVVPTVHGGGYVLEPGGGKMDFCWLVWERGYTGEAEIKWLRRDAPATLD